MRYNDNGIEHIGIGIDLEFVNNSNDRALYITDAPSCADSYDLQLIGIRGADLELLYTELGKFLGKV